MAESIVPNHISACFLMITAEPMYIVHYITLRGLGGTGQRREGVNVLVLPVIEIMSRMK